MQAAQTTVLELLRVLGSFLTSGQPKRISATSTVALLVTAVDLQPRIEATVAKLREVNLTAS